MLPEIHLFRARCLWGVLPMVFLKDRGILILNYHVSIFSVLRRFPTGSLWLRMPPILKVPFRTWVSLAAALLIVGFGSWACFRAYGQVRDSASYRLHLSEVSSLASEFAAALTDAETGQRGFALTGDPAFLEPYDAVAGQLTGKLNNLRNHTTLPAAQQHLDAIRPLLDRKADGRYMESPSCRTR